ARSWLDGPALATEIVFDLFKILDGVVFGFAEFFEPVGNRCGKLTKPRERINRISYRLEYQFFRGSSAGFGGDCDLGSQRFGDFNTKGHRLLLTQVYDTAKRRVKF